MFLPLVAAFALLAPPPAPAAPPAGRPGVNALLEQVLEAYGGRGPLAAGRAFRQRGSVTSMLHPGERGRIERGYVRPGRLRVAIRFPGTEEELRIVDGGRGWRNGQPADGARVVAMILQAARLDLPALLDAWRQKVVDRGEAVLEGRALRVLALEVGPGLTVEAHVDPATGRILRSRGLGASAGPGLEFVTTYSDFRPVGGVLFAFREGNWANGAVTGETILEEVELLASLPEATFRP